MLGCVYSLSMGLFLRTLLALTTSLGIVVHFDYCSISIPVFLTQTNPFLVLASAGLAGLATALGALLVGLRRHLQHLRQGLTLVRAHRLLHVRHPCRALAARHCTLLTIIHGRTTSRTTFCVRSNFGHFIKRARKDSCMRVSVQTHLPRYDPKDSTGSQAPWGARGSRTIVSFPHRELQE